MAILCYSTSVLAEKTANEIQALLAKKGAKQIVMDFDKFGRPSGLHFVLHTPHGERMFTLPVNTAGVQGVLIEEFGSGRRYTDHAHARNVAWRIAKTWLVGELAVIESGLVTLDEVLFPYMTLQDGQTAFQVYRNNQKALPAGGTR